MDAAQKSATQQSSTLPPESLRQDNSPPGASCVTFPACHFTSALLMCYLRSASGAGKEEQGQKAKEESACCIESIPVDTFRSLIAVNQGRSYYSMGICGLPMHTYTYTCQAMSVAMLPCRNHDVQLCDKHVPVFPLLLYWRKSEQKTVRIKFVTGCDCGGICWRLLVVRKTSCR
jgi:hypothetical protein